MRRSSRFSREETELACVLNRWVPGLGAATPGGGADSETGQGSSLRRAGEGRVAASPWWQQRRLRQRKVDAVKDTKPKVWSGLGSSVEPVESEEVTQTNKLK